MAQHLGLEEQLPLYFYRLVRKIINAKLILNPKIDDSSVKYRNASGKYLMFKEDLGISIDYNF